MKLIGRMMPSSQLTPQMRNPKAPAERIRLFRRRRKFRRQLVTVEVDPIPILKRLIDDCDRLAADLDQEVRNEEDRIKIVRTNGLGSSILHGVRPYVPALT